MLPIYHDMHDQYSKKARISPMFIRQATISDQILKQLRAKWVFRRITDAEKRLIARLPQEAMLLTKEEWRILHKVLSLRRHFPQASHNSDEETIVLLKTLADFGDRVDLPYLPFWVDTVLSLWANETSAVLDAVQDCLPVLQGRLQSKTAGTYLLRPASAEASPEQLLRPASGAGETNPETLLRASDA